ncbi:sensor histidine kinase [Pontiella sulfatireligans]|uniref:sensor histidine kinase n=1 Tax=Pontiella sulfatireligans TaxID=2750658 RepID=UPI001443E168|nr:HAMP domain-containing sensor histidine kinase [Pontiella sulfatireligans]
MRGSNSDRLLERVAQPGNSQMAWAGRDSWDNTPEELLEYSWRLDHGDWSRYSLETDRMFPDLPHGRHVLEVRARDRDYNVDPTPAVAGFSVVPSVWLQAWFVTMVISFLILVAMLIWIIIRIRERHLIEQQVEREKHLVEMDRIKTGFFTNISHELNTPLALIKGPLESMLEAGPDEDGEQLLSLAMRNVDRVANLVSQLLDFRKLEQGQMRIEAEEGNISRPVRECVDLLQPLAKRHKVSCHLEMVEPCMGWFDADKLKKIVQNLIVNAIKYSPSDGEVRVLLDAVPGQGGGRTLSLIVEDTGRGIAPKHLHHIFDRFYRVPEKTIVDGSGIGLNLTKELVDLWGGEIRAESPIHQDVKRPGTRFLVHLPVDLENISNKGSSHG